MANYIYEKIWVAFVLVVLLALGLRVFLPTDPWFWYDEIYQATYASQTMLASIIGTLRFDLHPPLHSVQMTIWGWFGQSDFWLFLNSVFWGTLAVILVFLCTRQRLGAVQALTAALILALLPAAIATSQTLRMYPMLMVLAVLTWHFSVGYLQEDRGKWSLIGLAIVSLAAVYTHATGIFVAVAAGIFGLLVILLNRPQRHQITGWVVAQVVIVLLALPAIVNTLVRSIGHMRVPDLSQIWITLGQLTVSTTGYGEPPVIILLSVLLLMAVIGIISPLFRFEMLAYVIFPILMVILLSYLFRPVWHARALYFMVPFLAIGASLGIFILVKLFSRWWGTVGRVASATLASIVVFALLPASVLDASLRTKPHNYPAAAAYISENVGDNDVVLVPHHAHFWAINRYLIGPRWGSILEVQGWPETPVWQDIYSRLGPEGLERVFLKAEARYVSTNGFDIFIGHEFDPKFGKVDKIWIVNGDRQLPELPWLNDMGFEEHSAEHFRGGLFVWRFDLK